MAFAFLALLCFLIKEGAERAYDKFQNLQIKIDMSTLYHIMSLVIRVFLFFIIGLETQELALGLKLFWLGSFALIAWPIYNITINIFRKDKWYYVGKSGIDGLIRKIFFFINFDKK